MAQFFGDLFIEIMFYELSFYLLLISTVWLKNGQLKIVKENHQKNHFYQVYSNWFNST